MQPTPRPPEPARRFYTPAEAAFYVAECQIATLAGLMDVRKTAKYELRRQESIARTCIAVCLDHFGGKIDGEERFSRTMKALAAVKRDPGVLEGTVPLMPAIRESESLSRRESWRLAMMECRDCSGSRLAGQAFTRFTCEKCGEAKLHPNTAVPRICEDCAKTHGICCRCGGPMD